MLIAMAGATTCRRYAKTDRSSGATAWFCVAASLRLPTGELVGYAEGGLGRTPVTFKHLLAPPLERWG